MGKRGRIIGLALLTAALLAAPASAEETVPAQGEAPAMSLGSERRIEQVYLNLPEVYVYGEGYSAQEVEAGEAYLSQDKLELLSVQPFSQRGEGITYYVLLDISGSIPGSYFSAIKEGIQSLQDNLGAQDRMVLCTFGEEVKLAADGNQTSQELAGILAELRNKDQETLLFEGIDQVTSLAEQTRGTTSRRQVLIVVSDGEDFATGKKMAQEALASLKDKGLPVYAACIRDTDKVNINSFGEFSRTSGGKMVTFSAAEGAGILTGIAADLQDDLCAEYRAESNVVSNKEENFSFQFADDSVLSRAVMNVHWIPDNEAPYLISGEAIGTQQIRLLFSEPMTGLAGAANYVVTLDGQEIGVTGVAYDKEDETKITLTLAEPVKNGTYKVTGANLTDASMEKNPLEGSLQVEIRGVKEPEEPKPPKFDGPNYAGLIFLLVLAVIVLIIVVVVVNKKKKDKENTQEGSGGNSGSSDSSVVLQDEAFRGRVVLPPGQKLPLNVVIAARGRRPKKTVWELGSSLIVGRSSICDIAVEDIEMSRQHFCLEREGGNVFISDLGSTNGTSVNGIRIMNKRLLAPGELIEAGSMKFTIRW